MRDNCSAGAENDGRRGCQPGNTRHRQKAADKQHADHAAAEDFDPAAAQQNGNRPRQ